MQSFHILYSCSYSSVSRHPCCIRSQHNYALFFIIMHRSTSISIYMLLSCILQCNNAHWTFIIEHPIAEQNDWVLCRSSRINRHLLLYTISVVAIGNDTKSIRRESRRSISPQYSRAFVQGRLPWIVCCSVCIVIYPSRSRILLRSYAYPCVQCICIISLCMIFV